MKKTILYIVGGVVALVVVVGASLGGAYLMIKKLQPAAPAPAAAAAVTTDLSGATVLKLDEFVTNLADTNPRYIKVTMQLVISGATEQTRLQKNMPRVRDTVVQLLNTKKSMEVTGNEGANKLKSDVKDVVNKALGGNPVTEVLITDIVVQF